MHAAATPGVKSTRHRAMPGPVCPHLADLLIPVALGAGELLEPHRLPHWAVASVGCWNWLCRGCVPVLTERWVGQAKPAHACSRSAHRFARTADICLGDWQL